MVRENEIRDGEVAAGDPPADATLAFIGRIRTPWTSRMATPRQGRQDGPICRIEVFPPWNAALASRIERIPISLCRPEIQPERDESTPFIPARRSTGRCEPE
ncbi:hypothetical protein [Amaricoccus sp.]|uniref:hypothetical protein n=1 Tax=Amaricoccus sp. TaxID=1872485 RepID=UPI00261FB782|nr:hypothetical protein [Amaricoccus sp.]HRO11235.1 hypothetical protein [Amaricoccus sp.]